MRSLLKSFDAHSIVPVGLALMLAGAAMLPIFALLVDPSFPTVMGPVGVLAFGIPFTHLALRHATTRMEVAVADRLIEPRPPAQ
jgi:hypothetical protein